MPRQVRLVCVSCAVLALLAPVVGAAEAQTSAEDEKAAKVFESLFGADVARVAKTRDARDDIDLAKRLLETARGDAAGKPALVTVLCEKAFDLASGHADGYATAVYGCQAPKADVVRAGQWNRMAIAASGNRIAVDLNGTRIIDMDLARWTTPGRNPDGSPNKLRKALKDMTGAGRIGFQDYGSNIMFRNIRIKPLGK